MASNSTAFSKTDEPFGKVVPINRYVRVETVLLQCLGWQAAYLYALLAFKCGKNGKCWPRQATLADELGVTTRHVQRMLNVLRDAGLVHWTRARDTNFYEVYPVTEEWLATRTDVMSDTTSMSPLDTTSVSHIKRKDHHQNLKPKPPEAKPAASVVEAPSEPTPKISHPPQVTTPEPGPTPKITNPEKPKTVVSQKIDDDEKPKAPITPGKELLMRWEARHPAWPEFDRNACLHEVKQTCDRENLPLPVFLDYDQAHTTGKRFTNPHGYYRNLARRAIDAANAQALEASAKFLGTEEKKPSVDTRDLEAALCQKCDLGKLPDGNYCSCPKGPTAKQLDEMAPMLAARKAARAAAA